MVLASALNGVDTCSNGTTNCTPPDLEDLSTVISNITSIALGLIGTIALLFLIQGGLLYLTSGGNPDQVMKAKNMIFYSIVGLILSIFSWAIIIFIIKAF